MYRAELRYVWNSLRRMGIPPRALEDATHDVFVVVHRKLPEFDATRPVRPWLFGIAFRVAAAYRRRSGERNEILHPESQAGRHDPWPQLDARDEVLQALGMLEWEARAVLILHDIDGATANDISRETGFDAVYSRIRAARRDFRRALSLIRGEAPHE